MYLVTVGTCYESINRMIIYSNLKNKSQLKKDESLLNFLKYLKLFDDSLKDFSEYISTTFSVFTLCHVLVTFIHLFYVVGFIFLNRSPQYMTFRNSAFFYVLMFMIVVSTCKSTTYQVK